MKRPHRSLPRFILTLTLTLLPPALLPIGVAPARAATTCRDVHGIGAEIAKFLDETAAAQAAGQGTLPLRDALFGVTNIDAEDEKALDARALVHLTRRDATGGDYTNDGPEKVTIEGVFADQETYFRMPRKVRGRYTIGANGSVTLLYDPKHTVDLGEPHVGMRFFKGTHHTVITREGVSFFLDDNAGPDPDRCYRAVP
jgi:hypothetical protein